MQSFNFNLVLARFVIPQCDAYRPMPTEARFALTMGIYVRCPTTLLLHWTVLGVCGCVVKEITASLTGLGSALCHCSLLCTF